MKTILASMVLLSVFVAGCGGGSKTEELYNSFLNEDLCLDESYDLVELEDFTRYLKDPDYSKCEVILENSLRSELREELLDCKKFGGAAEQTCIFEFDKEYDDRFSYDREILEELLDCRNEDELDCTIDFIQDYGDRWEVEHEDSSRSEDVLGYAPEDLFG